MDRRRRAASLALLALVTLLVLGTAAPASAHATLIGTDPAEGAVLEAAPERVRFTFDEPVVGVPDGVQAFDAQGEPIDVSSAVSGRQLDVTLDEEVETGTLVVVWRVLSEDGHPIHGSLSFSVGAPSASLTPPPADATATTRAPWTLSVVRGVGYVGLLLAAGLVAFAVLLLPGPLEDRTRRRVVSVARAGAAAAVLAWLVGLPLTAVYQLGGGAGSLARGATWAALPPAEYAVTAAVVLGVALAVALLGRGASERWRRPAAVGAGGVALLAPALTGHTRAQTPEALAVAADMLHLLAGGVWLGGLVGLALVLPGLSGRDTRSGEVAGEVLARFSGVAAGILAALVATGGLLAWRIVGSWAALVETGYGRLLLGKVAIVGAAVLIAAWNRYGLLPRLRQATRRRDRESGSRVVVRATAAEASVLLAVLMLTGLLVDKSPEPDAPPAAAEAVRTGPRSAPLGDVTVEATLAPQTIGPNTLTLQLRDSTGAPAVFFEPPRARLLSDGDGVDGVDGVDLGTVALTSEVAGTHTAQVVIPSPGTWRLQVSLRTSTFDNPVAYLEFTVS